MTTLEADKVPCRDCQFEKIQSKNLPYKISPFNRHLKHPFADSSSRPTGRKSIYRNRNGLFNTGANMTDEQLSKEIREANLTYLMLAQNMIRKDKAEALFRLGISDESATLVAALSAMQILKIASGNMLLCNFRVTDDIVWNLLTNHTTSKVDNDATTKLHASILMAGRYAETM